MLKPFSCLDLCSSDTQLQKIGNVLENTHFNKRQLIKQSRVYKYLALSDCSCSMTVGTIVADYGDSEA